MTDKPCNRLTLFNKVKALCRKVAGLKDSIESIEDELGSETEAGTIQYKLAHKQDTLTAGTNITIEDNVISATGGGSLPTGKYISSVEIGTSSQGTVSLAENAYRIKVDGSKDAITSIPSDIAVNEQIEVFVGSRYMRWICITVSGNDITLRIIDYTGGSTNYRILLPTSSAIINSSIGNTYLNTKVDIFTLSPFS